ncbi:MAG: hypothetical protein ACLQIB_37910 [Isosphaeraceae bacterium]
MKSAWLQRLSAHDPNFPKPRGLLPVPPEVEHAPGPVYNVTAADYHTDIAGSPFRGLAV